MYAISDTLDDPRGRWQQTAPWDTTRNLQASKGFLSTQEHVDLRSFRPSGLLVLTQADLDLRTETQMDVINSSLEFAPGVSDEGWTKSGTGFNAMTVGKLSGRSGWSGLTMTTSGAAISTTLASSMTKPIDISHETNLSLIFPDFNTFDGTSYVQMTSDPNGTFGTGHDSAQVLFSTNGSVMPQLRLAISAFASSGFTNTAVTGIRIVLVKATAPSSGVTFTLMAIRALPAAWSESALDFDTRFGIVTTPVTLDGNAYGGTVAQNFIFVRGDQTKSDPIPADGAMNIYFNAGGDVNPVGGSTFNSVSAVFREVFDNGLNTGAWFEGRLKWNSTGSLFEVISYSDNAGTVTTATLGSDTTLGGLSAGSNYVLSVTWRGTSVSATLYSADARGVPQTFVWKTRNPITHANLTYRNGRVGFRPVFADRDAFISDFEVATTGFAHWRSQVYLQRTPVDGAQLSATFSADENLFSSFTGSDLFIDQTKTTSGNGSYKTTTGLQTNQFIVDDWTQTYFSFDIWVPSGVSFANQPQASLVTPTGAQTIILPKLQPAQWNSVVVDLGNFRNSLTSVGYYIDLVPAPQPDQALGAFWVDKPIIGRRKVAWRARATANGPFRDFFGMVGEARGALHFTPEERGTQFQIECEALTEDAWVSSFKVQPRHAQLGNPVYDQAFATR